MIEPNGQNDVRLTPIGTRYADDRDASWSPNGKFIVYASKLDTESQYSLRIYKVGDPTTPADDDDDPLNVNIAGTKLRPAWSPDGTKIAFVSQNGPGGSDADIAIVTVNPCTDPVSITGAISWLTVNSYTDYDPTWSPDSQYIAYSTSRNGNVDIYRTKVCVATDGCEEPPDLKQLTFSTAADRNPSWSPDGSTIAFVSERDGNREIYTMSAELGESDAEHLIRTTDNGATDDDPNWEPVVPRLATLVYAGPRFVTGESAEVIDEDDSRITSGDHVHLRLPFRNNSDTAACEATAIEVWGVSHSPVTPGVSVYDATGWRNNSEPAISSLL